MEHVEGESRGPYFPYDRREPYPKRLKVDFRRLTVSASVRYGVDISRGVGVDVRGELELMVLERCFRGKSYS